MLSLLLLAAATPAPEPARAPNVTSAPYGTTKSGEAVERFVLTNRHGMRVAILTYGGIVDEISLREGRKRSPNLVLALPDLAAHQARANFGSLIGRYAGRISQGGFTLDGQRVALSDDPAAVVSHGSKPSFGSRVWRAEPCSPPPCSALTLRLASADGDNLFPGRLEVAVTYTLTADNALRLDYRATTTRPTPVNLTHHVYFNLAGGSSGSADNQLLQVNAARVAELDSRRVPTGRLLPVAGTPFDLRTPARIGDRVGATDPQMLLARGFDHAFELKGKGLRTAACALDPASGRMLALSTTEPALQVFTANSFDGTLVGAGGRTIRQGAGFALETQHFPDSPNRPEFPSTILRPGETLASTTSFRFAALPPGRRGAADLARRCR